MSHCVQLPSEKIQKTNKNSDIPNVKQLSYNISP